MLWLLRYVQIILETHFWQGVEPHFSFVAYIICLPHNKYYGGKQLHYILNYNSRNLSYLQCGRHKLNVSRNSYITLCHCDVTGMSHYWKLFNPIPR